MNLIRVIRVYVVYIICLHTTRSHARLMRTINRLNIKSKVKKLTIKLELRCKIPKVSSLATNNSKANKYKITRISLFTKLNKIMGIGFS